MTETINYVEQLEHLIFNENKTVTYKWVTNHFRVPIQKSKQLLHDFVSEKQREELEIRHAICGLKPHDKYGKIYAIDVVSHQDLEATVSSFASVKCQHIFSIGPVALDHKQTAYLADMDKLVHIFNERPEDNHLITNEFGMISNPRISRLAARAVPKPIRPVVKKKSSATPQTKGLKRKLADLELTDKSESPAKKRRKLSPKVNGVKKTPKSPPAEKKKGKTKTKGNKNKKNTLENAFAKSKPSKKKPKTVDSNSTSNSPDAMEIDEEPKRRKPRTTTRRTNKKQPVTTSGLAAIQYDSETSESDAPMESENDEDLEELVAYQQRRRKRNQIVDSDEDDEDRPAKKLGKRELARLAKEKEREERKRNFFAGHGDVGFQKKKKLVTKSWVDEDGMLVVDDVWETDEDAGSDKENGEVKHERVHDGQKPKSMFEPVKMETNGTNGKVAPKKTTKKQKPKPKTKKTQAAKSLFAFGFGKKS